MNRKLKYYLSNAPKDIPRGELRAALLMRWPIEQCFEDGKRYLGMDHYEHRMWKSWHRHMLYVFLALLFLLRVRLALKKTPTLTLPQVQRLLIASFEPEAR